MRLQSVSNKRQTIEKFTLILLLKQKKKKTKKHTAHNRPGMVRERAVAIEVYTHGIYCRFGMTHKQFTCWLLDNLRTYTRTHTPIGFLYGCNIAYGQSQFHINLYIYRNMHFNLSMRMSWHAFMMMMIWKTAIAQLYGDISKFHENLIEINRLIVERGWMYD